MEKLNLTQQHTFSNQRKCTTTQNKHKKLKSGLVASYNIRAGNREGLFWFRHFINLSLTYLLRYLPTYLPPRDTHGEAGARFTCPYITQLCQSTEGKLSLISIKISLLLYTTYTYISVSLTQWLPAHQIHLYCWLRVSYKCSYHHHYHHHYWLDLISWQ